MSGRQVYVYQGQEYSLPDTYSPEEALNKIKGHVGVAAPEPAQDVGFMEAAKRGLEDAGRGLMNAWDFTAGGLAGALGAEDDSTKIFDQMNARQTAYNEELQGRQGETQGFASKGIQAVVGGLPQMLTSHATETAENSMAGATPEQALKGLAVDTALQGVNLALPAGRGLKVGAAVGAGTNLGTDIVGDLIKSKIYENTPIAPRYNRTAEDYALSAVVGAATGGTLGALAGKKIPVDRPDPSKFDNLDKMEQPAPEAMYRDPSTGVMMGEKATPEMQQYMAERQQQSRADRIIEEQKAQARAEAEGVETDIRDTRIRENTIARAREEAETIRTARAEQAQAKVDLDKRLYEAAQQNPEILNQRFLNALAEDRKLVNPEQLGVAKDPNAEFGFSGVGGKKIAYTPPTNMNKQRGGVDFNAIVEGLGGIADRFKRPLNNIPGHKDTGVDMIATYPDVAKSIDTVKAAQVNTRVSSPKLKPGGSFVGVTSADPLIQTGIQFMQTARKMADRNIQRYVKPVEDTLQRLKFANKGELIELATLMKKEMFERKSYTPEQLQQAGFNAKQVEAYTSVRKAYNKAWEVQNNALKAQGLPELTKSEYYLSSRWDGDWSSHIYSPDGKLIWVIKDKSEKGVQAAKNYMKEQGIPIDESKSRVEFTKKNFRTPDNLTAAYASMIQHVGENSPLAAKARELMEARVGMDAHNTLAQSKHFESKANVRGFVGDRPWVEAGKDASDLFNQQVQYMKNAFEWSELNKASNDLKQVISDPTIMKNSPDSVQWVKDYMDRQLGSGEHKIFQAMENSVAKSLGRSTSDINNVVNTLKTGYVLKTLGFNTGNFIANLLQFTNVTPWHRVLSNEGYKHNAAKTILATTMDTSGGLARHYGNRIGAGSRAPMTEIGKQALKYAEDNGIISLSTFDEHTNINTGRFQRSIQNTLGQAITQSDKMTRWVAFMSYVHHLEQSGKFKNRMDVFKEAEQWVNATMVDPRMSERPWIVQDTGVIGSAGYTLQSYVANYFNQLATLSNRAYNKKEVVPLMAFLGNSVALAGLGGLPGAEAVMSMYDVYREYLAENNPAKYPDSTDIRKTLSDMEMAGGVEGALAKGPLSQATGIDLASKFEVNPSVPGAWMADVAKQAGAVGKAVVSPSKETIANAAYQVAPVGVPRGLLEIDSGMYNTGDKFVSPTNMDYEKGFMRSDKDKLFKRIGLTSQSEAFDRERSYLESRDRATDTAAKASSLKKAVRSMIDGSGKVDNSYIKTYVKLTGGENLDTALQQGLERELMARNLSPDMLKLARARGYDTINRWIEYYGTK